MFSPLRNQCGISDYTSFLVDSLRDNPEISDVRMVDCDSGKVHDAKGYRAEERRYKQLGLQMNWTADANSNSVAHIQHQYFHFGGVAPQKTHIRAFLNSIKSPCVMTVHEIVDELSGASPPIRIGIRVANRMNFLHSAINQFIVHTRSDREKLVNIGVNSSKISVVVHGIPPAQPMPNRLEAKQKLSLDGKMVVTLFGFLSRKKGHHLAVAAMKMLPENVVLLLAGGQHPDDHTSYTEDLKHNIESAGLAERVRITGYLPLQDIPVWMAATDAAIAPYEQTSGSGSIANLLAYGRPVIASDIDPHVEISEDLPSALRLFKEGSAESLSSQIDYVLNNEIVKEQLSTAALEYARRHSYEGMARETIAIYRKI